MVYLAIYRRSDSSEVDGGRRQGSTSSGRQPGAEMAAAAADGVDVTLRSCTELYVPWYDFMYDLQL